MNARIDIKTPAGKSLEGFPKEITSEPMELFCIAGTTFGHGSSDKGTSQVTLHKGDTITIEIL